jgi:hypothetical protein
VGYDVHITRKANWFDKEGPAISLDEWTTVVRNDPEMRLDGYAEARVPDSQVLRVDSDGLSVWTAYSGHEMGRNAAWSTCATETLSSRIPILRSCEKMYVIAQHLSGKVQGDDGELYDSQGNVSPAPTDRSPVKKSRWKLW